jgi:hypothetical protein
MKLTIEYYRKLGDEIESSQPQSFSWMFEDVANREKKVDKYDIVSIGRITKDTLHYH